MTLFSEIETRSDAVFYLFIYLFFVFFFRGRDEWRAFFPRLRGVDEGLLRRTTDSSSGGQTHCTSVKKNYKNPLWRVCQFDSAIDGNRQFE